LLFFLSGLDTGLSLFVLLGLSGVDPGADLHLIARMDIFLMPLVLLTLGVYLYNARQGGPAARQSLGSLQNAVFIGGVLLVGILLPLGLAIWLALPVDIPSAAVLGGLSAGATLIGGLCLRYSIVHAGVNLSEIEEP
jgi:formate-dependent nitrite reductase membrane component NrfD